MTDTKPLPVALPVIPRYRLERPAVLFHDDGSMAVRPVEDPAGEWVRAEDAERAIQDANLRADNAEIATQQEMHRTATAGALLEKLSFWPSPTADQNLARDIGRVLQGKPSEKSSGLEPFPAPLVRSWKQRAETAEAARLLAEQ